MMYVSHLLIIILISNLFINNHWAENIYMISKKIFKQIELTQIYHIIPL